MRPGVRSVHSTFDFVLSGAGFIRAALFIFLAASSAAVIAHIAIDVLGDVLLAHDTYDDVAHASRGVVSCACVAATGAAALRLLVAALDRTRAPAPHQYLRGQGNGCAFVSYAALVVVSSLILLTGMEGADLLAAGQPLGDLDDLLGGSIALALGVALPTALSIAYGTWRIARWLAIAQFVAIRIMRALLVLRVRRARVDGIFSRDPISHLTRAPALARRASKRGPPSRLR